MTMRRSGQRQLSSDFRISVQTTVMLDLVGYSIRAAILEESLGVIATAALNSQIRKLIDDALAAAAAAQHNLLATSGDGALLCFDQADQALAFTVCLHEAARLHNRGRVHESAHRTFRIGVATGEIFLDRASRHEPASAGMTIVRAARLQAAASPGGTLLDLATYEAASRHFRMNCRGPFRVAGKHGEEFKAYRRAGPAGVRAAPPK